MTKEVQMSIKMEPELREQFMAVAATMHRPAAQIVRDLMRSYIARQEMPNAETIAAIEAVERGEVTTHASTADLYRTLGI
jgi:predicted transcriptional regulator